MQRRKGSDRNCVQRRKGSDRNCETVIKYLSSLALIVPCTFNPGQEARYQLRVISNNAHPPLKLLPPMPLVSVKGAWEGKTAGGTINNKATWKNNPQFALHVTKAMALTFVLTQHRPETESAYGIGFIIFGGNGEKIETPIASNMVLKGDYRPDRTVRQTATVPARATPYIVVPSTFEAGQECSFTLSVTCDDSSMEEHVRLEKIA